jgi:hypothetical protein
MYLGPDFQNSGIVRLPYVASRVNTRIDELREEPPVARRSNGKSSQTSPSSTAAAAWKNVTRTQYERVNHPANVEHATRAPQATIKISGNRMDENLSPSKYRESRWVAGTVCTLIFFALALGKISRSSRVSAGVS